MEHIWGGLFHLQFPLYSIPYPSTRVSRMYVCIYVAPFVCLLSYQLWNLKPFLSSSEGMVQIHNPKNLNSKQHCSSVQTWNKNLLTRFLVLGFHAWFLESNNTAPEKTEVKSVPKNRRSCSWRLCFLITIDHHDWVFLLFLEMWQKQRKHIVLECFAWILGGFLCTYVYAPSGADEVSW